MAKLTGDLQEDTGIKVPNLGSNSTPQQVPNLFQSLSGAIPQIAGVIDDGIKSKIKTDAQEIFQDANKPFTGQSDLPPDVQRAEVKMGRLRQAYNQGKLSDTAYYSQLTAGVKRLKSRYPGYSNEVDKIIQSVAGVRPANALRNALLSEIKADEKAQSKTNNDFYKFVTNQGNSRALMGAFPDIFTNPEAYDEPHERAKVYQSVAKYNGIMGEKALIKENLSVDKAQYEANKTVIDQKLNQVLAKESATFISGMQRIVERSLGGKDFMTVMTNMASGKIKPKPEELEQMRTQISVMRDEVANRLATDLSESTNGLMSPDEINKKVSAALVSADRIIANLGSGDTDLAGIEARVTKTQNENDIAVWSKLNPGLALMATLSQKFPAIRDGLSTNPLWNNQMSEIDGTISLMITDRVTQGEELAKTLSTLSTSDLLTPGQKGSATKTSIDMMSVMLSDAGTSPEGFKEVFDSVYGQGDIFQNIATDNQMGVYTKLTNPQITARVMATGDQGVIDQYYDWSVGQLRRIGKFREMAGDLSVVENTRDFLNVEVSEDGRMNIFIDEDKFTNWAQGTNPLAKREMMSSLKKTVDNVSAVNKTFTSLGPIIKGAGKPVSETLQAVLADTGIDLQAREESWLQWALNSSGQANKESKQTQDSGQKTTQKFLNEFLSQNPEWVQSEKMRQRERNSSKISDPQTRNLLDQIGRAEGAGYDTVFGNNQKKYGWKPSRMTIGEVKKAQKVLARATGSSAFGKYQVIQKTLAGAVRALGLKDSDVFNEETQDRIALYLLDQRGYSAYKAGKLSPVAFQEQVSMEWASIPSPSGQSFYAGDKMGNKASLAGRTLAASL